MVMNTKNLKKNLEQLENLEKEIQLAAAQLLDYDNTNKSLKSENEKLEKKKNKISSEIKVLNKDVDKIKSSLKDYKEKMNDSISRIEQTQKISLEAIADAEKILQEKSKKLKLEERILVKEKESFQEMRSATLELQISVLEKETFLDEKLKSLKVLEDSIKPKRKTLDKKIKEASETKKMSDSLISKYKIKKAELDKREASLDSREVLQHNEKNRIERLIKVLDKAKRENERLSAKWDQEKNELEKVKLDIELQREELNKELHQNECTLREVQKTLNMVKEKQMVIANIVADKRIEDRVKELGA